MNFIIIKKKKTPVIKNQATLILFSVNKYLLSTYYLPGTRGWRSEHDKNFCLPRPHPLLERDMRVRSRNNSLRRWRLSLVCMLSLVPGGRPGSGLPNIPFPCALLTTPQLCLGQQCGLPRWHFRFPGLCCTQFWPRRPDYAVLLNQMAFKDKKSWLNANNCLPLVAWRK